ncbi:hypothetical protein TWF730_008000 [Orbilia blumenaviensis]|uniref:Uncharacterized protein n=1 Tax=Orbilia blumenaviensis TaxID=1796055 RepID=A0AAV9V9M8_9PEZI
MLPHNIFNGCRLVPEYLQVISDQMPDLAAGALDKDCAFVVGLFCDLMGGAVGAFFAGKGLSANGKETVDDGGEEDEEVSVGAVADDGDDGEEEDDEGGGRIEGESEEAEYLRLKEKVGGRIFEGLGCGASTGEEWVGLEIGRRDSLVSGRRRREDADALIVACVDDRPGT